MKEIGSIILTSSAHFSKVLLGFFLLKLIALYLGPAGLGKIGHLMSAVTLLIAIAGGGITNALVKYVSEYKNERNLLIIFLKSSFLYSFYFSTIIFFILIFLSKNVSIFLFESETYYWIVVALAFAQFGFAFLNFSSGIFNGTGHIKYYSQSQIIGNVIALLFIWVLVKNYGWIGSVFSIIFMYLIALLPATFYFSKYKFFLEIAKSTECNEDNYRKLSHYTLMLLTSALLVPFAEVFVRESLIQSSGYMWAGIWQSSIKLSSAYLGFFVVFFAYYFVPKISPIHDKKIILTQTLKMIGFVSCIFIICVFILYKWRDFFIGTLLSDEFIPLSNYIHYQLIGDFFKIVSYVIGFVAVAKAATKIYILAEVFQHGMFLSMIFIVSTDSLGLEYVMKAYVLTYVIYFLSSCLGFYIYVKK